MCDEDKVIKDKDLNEPSQYDDVKVRRKVRADYRSLANDIEENAQDVINPESTKLYECLEKAEDLFSKVRHPREAVHDSAFLLALTKKGREQAQQLKTDVISFDNHTFGEKLISYVNGRHITDNNNEQGDDVNFSMAAWTKLGNRACPLFKKAPSFDFLLGPLVLEVKMSERSGRKDVRKKVSEGDVVKLKQIASIEQQEEATTKEVERIHKMLKQCTKEGKTPICLFHFVINPQSFGQTVENMFHISFLIKDGRAIIHLDGDELPTINLHKEYREEDHEDVVARKQVVLPLTTREWQNLIEAFDITEPMIPTRKKVY